MPDDPVGATRTELATPPESEPAGLAAYTERTRRLSLLYAGMLAILVLACFVGVKVAYARGELDQVSFTTAPAPAAVGGSTPAPALRLAWQNGDRAAGGNPYADGIVVSYSAHTVNGRDALSGAVRWHYTRRDEMLCSVSQQDSSTIAIYRRKGNCDEVTGLTTATGEPKWYRTLTDDGSTVAASLPNVVLTVNAHTLHAFDNAGGLDRWDWDVPAGCSVRRALAGTLGVLTSLDCGAVQQLSLHDLIGKDTTWTVNTSRPMVPVAAGAFLGAVDSVTGILHLYSADKGADTAERALPLDAAAVARLPQVQASVTATDAGGQPLELVFAGRLTALSSTGSVRWNAAASTRAWPVATAFVVDGQADGTVALRRTDTGQVQLTSTLSPVPATMADAVFPVGGSLLLTGSSGLALYR